MRTPAAGLADDAPGAFVGWSLDATAVDRKEYPARMLGFNAAALLVCEAGRSSEW
ncbi:MAG: hypothetical protein M3380_00390 [Chloroflexota bacterium]|nr:hypothetical protein [Chloroflexota bacterium]